MTRLRGRRELPLSWQAKKKKKKNGEFDAGWWTSLLKVSGSEGCYTARQNDSFFPCTTLNRTLWNTSSDKGGKHQWSRAPSESLYNTSPPRGTCSQYSHASCECLYWKISCLSTWQTPSSLSERELKNQFTDGISVSEDINAAQTSTRKLQRMLHRLTL